MMVSLSALGMVLGVTFLLWLLSLHLKDVSIVDIFWGEGFMLLAWFCWVFSESQPVRGLVVACLISIWALRLAGYLFWRNHGKPEDSRYVAMRKNRGPAFWWISLFQVFWLQALLMWFVAMPIQAATLLPSEPFVLTDIAGFALFGVGLFFEAVGDMQLARFKGNPDNKGKVLNTGLWRYTRHPNYFGDCCGWWGIYVLVLPTGLVGAATILGPLLMTVLLLKVSGVALLERTITKRRPAYSDYIRRTSAFIPWPPRSD